MKKSYITILMIIATTLLYSQNSVMQDADGETSYQINKNLLALNTANSSFSLSGIIANFPNRRGYHNKLSMSSLLKANDGVTKVFGNGKIQFNGNVGLQYIINASSPVVPGGGGGLTIRHVIFNAEVLYSKINRYDSLRAFDKQLFSQRNMGFKGSIGYNWLGSFSAGISASFGIKDNTDELESQEIITSYLQTNGTATRNHSITENAYMSYLVERSVQFSNFNFDIGKYISNRNIFANLHLRYAVQEDLKPALSSSFGFFFTKDGAPLEAIAGLQLQTNDLTNTANAGTSRWDRSALVLTVGFPFD